MSWRTVVISSRCKLDYRMGFLVIRDRETKKLFLDEIAMLLIENPGVSMTGCLLEAMIERKIKVIFCDAKHNPCAELVPYYGSHDCSKKVKMQVSWTDGIKGALWTEIVVEKIRKQADFLKDLGKEREEVLLRSYLDQITFCDATNREGHAAKVYFNAVFGMGFSRSRESPVNAALNYGYSIVLSAFNREITSNGYLTQMGIFHDNMYNYFNLSCDLMEPYRILVDREVRFMKMEEFASEQKHGILNLLNKTVYIDGANQTILNAIKVYTRSFFESVNTGELSAIKFYDICPNKQP